VNIQVIRSRIECLNTLAEDEAPRPCAGRLSTELDSLPVTFFRDGVKVGDRAFTPYNLRPAQELIKDILDGYFPRALRESHPNGATLHVVDRTGNGFADWFRDFARDDPELADGGERLRPRCGRTVCAPGDAKGAGERLVSKLPERVVTKSGQVCDVRGAIAKRLGVACATSGNGKGALPGNSDASEEVSLLDTGRDSSAPSARLQVKLEGGQRVKLCMEPHATIGA
jgi:hypothetical protein